MAILRRKTESHKKEPPTCKVCGEKHWPLQHCIAKGKVEMDETKGQPGPKIIRKTIPSSAKFTPTCKMCGEKHWPFHPFVPCVNKKKAKAKAQKNNGYEGL